MSGIQVGYVKVWLAGSKGVHKKEEWIQVQVGGRIDLFKKYGIF